MFKSFFNRVCQKLNYFASEPPNLAFLIPLLSAYVGGKICYKSCNRTTYIK